MLTEFLAVGLPIEANVLVAYLIVHRLFHVILEENVRIMSQMGQESARFCPIGRPSSRPSEFQEASASIFLLMINHSRLDYQSIGQSR